MGIPIAISVVIFIVLLAVPWLSFALLLSIPVIKAPAEYYVPFFQTVDLTLLACGVTGVAAIWNLIRRPGRGARLALPWLQLGCMLLVGFTFLMGLAWTTAPEYGASKTIRFLGIGVPFLLLPSFLVRSKAEGRAIIGMISLLGALTACGVLFLPETYLQQITYGRGFIRATLLGGSAIMPAVIAAAGLIALLCMFMVGQSTTRLLRYGAIIVLPLGVIAILKTGTRSAFFALAMVATAAPLLSGRKTWGKGAFVALIALPLTVAAGLTYVASKSQHIADRWSRVAASGGASDLVESRTDHYAFCLQEWWRDPVAGHGPGSFAMDAMGQDELGYPHNIILEAMYETGLLGTIALLTFVFVTLRRGLRVVRHTEDPRDKLLVLAPLALFLLFLLQSMVHWDLDGVRFLYLFAGLLHACTVQVLHAPHPQAIVSPINETSYGRPYPTGA